MTDLIRIQALTQNKYKSPRKKKSTETNKQGKKTNPLKTTENLNRGTSIYRKSSYNLPVNFYIMKKKMKISPLRKMVVSSLNFTHLGFMGLGNE